MASALCAFVFAFAFAGISGADGFRARHRAGQNTSGSVVVGALADFEGGAWGSEAGCGDAPSVERVHCNLRVYAEGVKLARQLGVDMLVLTEYGLNMAGGHYDDVPEVGATLCESSKAGEVATAGLSCMAKEHGVALASNVLTSAEGKKYLTEVVFDKKGKIVAVYQKHYLFPVGEGFATSGPFNPTVFEMFEEKFGLIICWEGLKPSFQLWGGWDLMDALKNKGATTLLWSGGNSVFGGVLSSSAGNVASRLGVNVVAAFNKQLLGTSTAFISSTGQNLEDYYSETPLSRTNLQALGYTGGPSIRRITL